jgi:5'-deoxynucleotidase YfbR-like HD superfamily hydrolase
MNGKDRPALLALLSVMLAMMSVGTALYQNYIYTQQLAAIQRNVSRGEYIRTCKEVIDAYFQVKLKVGVIARAAERERAAGGMAESMMELEAATAVSKVGALGTYLANFQNEDVRSRYTQLTRTLEKILAAAHTTTASDLEKLFEPADQLFARMNDDCVRTAKAAPL